MRSSSAPRRSPRAAASAAAGALSLSHLLVLLPLHAPCRLRANTLCCRLLVPIFILVAGVPPSHATPLSVCAIAGGAVANYIAYSQRRRSDGAPLIDYGCAPRACACVCATPQRR
jgi:hypothetical protein